MSFERVPFLGIYVKFPARRWKRIYLFPTFPGSPTGPCRAKVQPYQERGIISQGL